MLYRVEQSQCLKPNSLPQPLWLDEDVEVGLLQLLCEHVKHTGLSREVCQVVHYQVQQQLTQGQRQEVELAGGQL